MGGRARVLVRSATVALRERRREALVVRLDRDVHCGAQGLHEHVRLDRLRAVLAAQRQRQADDDALDLVLDARATAARRARPRVAARATTPSGRAIVPVASETATPVRAAP